MKPMNFPKRKAARQEEAIVRQERYNELPLDSRFLLLPKIGATKERAKMAAMLKKGLPGT